MNSFSFNLSLPMVKESGPRAKVCTPESVLDLLRPLAKSAQEVFVTLSLDSKNKVIDQHIVTIGITDASLVHPREVFRAAIVEGASSIILAHNHPSGDTTPSREDLTITRQLVAAGEIIGIKVLDHVIIGDDYCSLRESALVNFM